MRYKNCVKRLVQLIFAKYYYKGIDKMLRIFILSLLLIVVISKSSYAYLDPGTGSLLLQALAAGLFFCVFFVKRVWRKVLDIFRKPVEENSSSDNK